MRDSKKHLMGACLLTYQFAFNQQEIMGSRRNTLLVSLFLNFLAGHWIQEHNISLCDK